MQGLKVVDCGDVPLTFLVRIESDLIDPKVFS